MTVVTISSTEYSTILCAHGYGDAWIVTWTGFSLLVCGTKLPKYLAKRLDTALDTDGVRYTSPDAQGAALYASAEFTEEEIDLLHAVAEVSGTRRNRIEWDMQRAVAVAAVTA